MQRDGGVVNVVVFANQTTAQLTVDMKTGTVRELAKDKAVQNKHDSARNDTVKSHKSAKKRP